MSQGLLLFLSVACTFSLCGCIVDITQFGAIPNSDTYPTQLINAKALMAAVNAANTTDPDRTVRVPRKTFYSLPLRVENAHNITFQIEGRLAASKEIRKWPLKPNSQYKEDFISFHSCSKITLHGGGHIDGRGYHWWMLLFLDYFGLNKILPDQNARPHLLTMEYVTDIIVHDLTLKNSPQFHFKLDHCARASIYNLDIKVNTTAQLNLLKRVSLDGVIWMFPFNTDGIDPSGTDMHIYNLTVQNWDDVVVPKPQPGPLPCTGNMLIENIVVKLGVGLTVGSVPPDKGCNCVKNVTFRNVFQDHPIKGIYIKSNPGDTGTGLIEDILYSNFTMIRPLWWAIYIGPQQMKEPDRDGPGCMLYPFDKHGTCTTQRLVTFNNITLRNVNIYNSLLYPVTIRCNVSNPCTNINFERVITDTWQIGQKAKGYVCEFATGNGIGNSPKIDCLDDNTSPSGDSSSSVETQELLDSNKQSLRSDSVDYSSINDQPNLTDLVFMMKEIEAAAARIGYYDIYDDQFDYDVPQGLAWQ